MSESRNTRETTLCEEERHLGRLAYTYRLIMREKLPRQAGEIPLFTVEVALWDGQSATCAKMRDGFPDAGVAMEFFRLAVRTLLTPSNLPYVLEDLEERATV